MGVSFTKKKASFTGLFLFFRVWACVRWWRFPWGGCWLGRVGCCVVVGLWGGVHFLVWCCWGVVLCWGGIPAVAVSVLGAWASAGVGAGGPVVGLWRWACLDKFEKWAACKSGWPRGYRSGLHFWTSPPLCVYIVPWLAWLCCGLGLCHPCDSQRVQITKKPTSHDAGDV